MTDQRLADELVECILRWRPAPDRYVKPVRGWTPRTKFRPLEDVKDALRLLDAATGDYVLTGIPGGSFRAEARLAGRIGKGVAESKARAICFALAELFGLEIDQIPGQSTKDKR